MTTTRNRNIPALTAMRGMAALAIVFFHAFAALAVGPALLDRAQVLKVAVTFFFVLSGFVLTLGWESGGLGKLLAATGSATGAGLCGHLDHHPRWPVLAPLGPDPTRPSGHTAFCSGLGAQARSRHGGEPVAWSLSCEIAFYLALPLVAGRVHAASDRTLRVATGAVCAWIAAGSLASLRFPIEWWPPYRASEFALGVCLAAWVARGWRPRQATMRLAVALPSLSVLRWPPEPLPRRLSRASGRSRYSFGRSQLLRGSAGFTGSFWTASGLQTLGRWSYALYLSHWITVVLISRFFVGAAWIAPAVIACVIVSGAIYVCVERPAEKKIRNIDFRQRTLNASRLGAA